MELETAAQLTGRIAGVGIIINALELLIARREIFRFFDWRILSTKYLGLIRRPRLLKLVSLACGLEGFTTLLLIQTVAATAVIHAGAGTELMALFCATVLAVHLYVHFRLVQGLDGSDQFHTVLWAALTVFYARPTPLVQVAAVSFIAAQFTLSYLTSGLAKAISPIWRSGGAVGMITRTKNYGVGWFRFLVAKLRLSWPLSVGTIVLEVGGPFSLLLGPRATAAFICASFTFHLGIAVVMGLNSFLWAFAAAYPSLYCVSEWIGLVG